MTKQENVIKDAVKKETELNNAIWRLECYKKPPAKYEFWYLWDIWTHLKLYNLVIVKKFNKARKYMLSMDSATRNNVPLSIYEYLNEAQYESN